MAPFTTPDASAKAFMAFYAPKALWVTVALLLPFSVTTSYEAGAKIARHEALDTLILRRLDALDAKVDRAASKTDSIKTTVDSLRWLFLDRERHCCTAPPLRSGP